MPDSQLADEAPDDRLLALDEALTRLGAEEPAVTAVIKLRYFAGLTIEEAADRHWAYAKA